MHTEDYVTYCTAVGHGGQDAQDTDRRERRVGAPYASSRPAWAHLPPDDTEESVLCTHLHQDTITNARTSINEVDLAIAGAAGKQRRTEQAAQQKQARGQGIIPYLKVSLQTGE